MHTGQHSVYLVKVHVDPMEGLDVKPKSRRPRVITSLVNDMAKIARMQLTTSLRSRKRCCYGFSRFLGTTLCLPGRWPPDHTTKTLPDRNPLDYTISGGGLEELAQICGRVKDSH
ncbi:unnamed protein product [Lepeophtheirus salmonis]|uniref:(salmon louse) hypothetical protein n=1 Tax=Lepeophtheirus salmonis TaxID=72036 RepID=A0A7R8CTN1_LEPSM|nr:unnamed protein product [Lepeophtheirus salmonis]CAF2874947.1 unnamed protein product [Lepeophtheirus salmonis]